MRTELLYIVLCLYTAISANAYDLRHGGFCYNYLSDSEVEVTFDYIDFKNQSQSFYQGDVMIPDHIIVDGTKEYSVTRIGENAFLYSQYLNSVSIPSSIVEIGSNAFGQCKNLTSINLKDGDNTLTTNAYTTTGYIPIFSGSPIKSLYVGRPCSYTILDNLENLETVKFRDSLTEIPRIHNAPKLTSISLPNKAEIIGGFPKTGLTQISLPETVKEICSGAFCETNLTTLDLPNGLLSIGAESFRECCISEITLPATCLSFGQAFYFSNLETIRILAPITKISAEDFYYCDRLKSISIPNTYSTIEHNAFEGCSSLESFVIPNSVETVEYEAFAGCSALKSITIGNNVYSIGDGAYKSCNGLEAVICLGYNAPIMIKSTFDDSAYRNVTLYYNETSIHYTADGSVWNNFVNKIAIDPESAELDSITIDTSVSIINYTNAQGVSSKTPFCGFNIIRYSNGKTKKVFLTDGLLDFN